MQPNSSTAAFTPEPEPSTPIAGPVPATASRTTSPSGAGTATAPEPSRPDWYVCGIGTYVCRGCFRGDEWGDGFWSACDPEQPLESARCSTCHAHPCNACGLGVVQFDGDLCVRCAVSDAISHASYEYLVYADTVEAADRWLRRTETAGRTDRQLFYAKAGELARAAAHAARNVASVYWTLGHDDESRNAIALELLSRTVASSFTLRVMGDELRRVSHV